MSTSDPVPPNPVKIIFGLVRSEWDASRTSLADPPRFGTGDWSSDDPLPAVIVHARDESPLDGGDTGIAGWNGASGMPVQRMQGTVLVDCVAGTRDECSNVGVDGTAVNPKTVRSELDTQVRQILLTHRPAGLRSLSPGSAQDIEATADEEDTQVSFSTQRRARYIQRHDATTE